jgi:hypothetical protein
MADQQHLEVKASFMKRTSGLKVLEELAVLFVIANTKQKDGSGVRGILSGNGNTSTTSKSSFSI